MSNRRRSWIGLVLPAAVPVAVAASWIPLRNHLPDTDLALVLVLVIAGIGWLAGRRGALVSAFTAGLAFDFLDTPPYGTLAMSRWTDALTAAILVLTGVLIGSASSVLARYRRSDDRRADALAVVMEASGLVATGGEQQLIAGALATELVRELELVECSFHLQAPKGINPTVARDGSLVGLLGGGDPEARSQIDLPVWSQGDVVGHYRLVLGQRHPTRQELRVALSLADQAGAAFAKGQQPPPPPPRPVGRPLRAS